MSVFRAALDLETYRLRNLIRPRCAERAKPGRGKPVLNLVEVSQCSLCILAFLLVFTPYLSNAVVSATSPHNFFCPCSTEAVGIAHKPPSAQCPACSARIVVDKQTDKWTHRMTSLAS